MSTATLGRAWKVAASLGLAVGLFAYFLWRAPLGDVVRRIEDIRAGWLAISVALALLSYFLRALRWGVILSPVGRASVPDLWGCTAAGFATSTILPARAGEVVRPLLLSGRSGLPAAGTLASIVTERLADLATIVVLFSVAVFAARSPLTHAWIVPLRRTADLIAIGLAAGVVAGLLLLHYRDAAVRRAARFAPARWREPVERFLQHVLDGIEVVRRPVQLTQLALWSLAVWAVIGLQVAALARAFDLSFGFGETYILITVSIIGLTVPTPGAVGGFHAAIQFALTDLFGLGLGPASAFALVHHAVCFFPITLIGLVTMAAYGLSFARVRHMGDAEQGGEGT